MSDTERDLAQASYETADCSRVKRPLHTAVNSVQLIEQVRARAALWRRGSAQYRSQAARERCWRDICRLQEPGYDDMPAEQRRHFEIFLMKRWFNIRDAYRKYLVARGKSACKPYLYADQLRFLDSQYSGKLSLDTPKKRKMCFTESEEEAEWLDTCVKEEEASGSKEPPSEQIEPPEDALVSALVGLLQREEDEDRAFFKSITPAVKALPHHHKFLFRIQVMKILDELSRRAHPTHPLHPSHPSRREDLAETVVRIDTDTE